MTSDTKTDQSKWSIRWPICDESWWKWFDWFTQQAVGRTGATRFKCSRAGWNTSSL